jgi:hypothetical protein
MGILRTKTIEPATGSTLTLGASGDTVTVSSDSIKANTFKDAGGNTLFTSDGAGTLSSVNSALAPAGPILISTHTASDSSSIDITSGIDSTYDEYMFVFTDVNPATDQAQFTFQVNAAGGSGFNETITSTFFAAYQNEGGSNTALDYLDQGPDQAQGTSYQSISFNNGNGSDESCAGIFHLFSPMSTAVRVTHFYSEVNAYHGSNFAVNNFAAGYINTTTPIDEISFKMTSGNFDGVIQMYGIK